MSGTGSPLSAEDKDILSASIWLSARSPKFRQAFLNLGGRVELPVNFEIYKRGRLANCLYGVIEGQIDVSIFSTHRATITTPNKLPGKYMPFSDLITKTPASADAVVRMPTLAHRVSRAALLRFLDEKPVRYRDVIAYDNAVRRETQRVLADTLTTTGQTRVLVLLLSLYEDGRFPIDRPIPVSQQNLAKMTGSSVPTIQRVFRKLKREGVLDTAYGGLVLRNPNVLRAIAESSRQENDRM